MYEKKCESRIGFAFLIQIGQDWLVFKQENPKQLPQCSSYFQHGFVL